MSTHEKLLTVEPDGRLITLFDDNLPDLGPRFVGRASHLIPAADGSWWSVTLSNADVNGRFAGKHIGGAKTREDALRLERHVIEQLIFRGPKLCRASLPESDRDTLKLLSKLMARSKSRPTGSRTRRAGKRRSNSK